MIATSGRLIDRRGDDAAQRAPRLVMVMVEPVSSARVARPRASARRALSRRTPTGRAPRNGEPRATIGPLSRLRGDADARRRDVRWLRPRRRNARSSRESRRRPRPRLHQERHQVSRGTVLLLLGVQGGAQFLEGGDVDFLDILGSGRPGAGPRPSSGDASTQADHLDRLDVLVPVRGRR